MNHLKKFVSNIFTVGKIKETCVLENEIISQSPCPLTFWNVHIGQTSPELVGEIEGLH